MTKDGRSLWIGLGAILLSAAAVAPAQNSSDGVIGPPQLKDFSLEPRETIVSQPAPTAPPPAELAPASPAAAPPRADARPEAPPARAAAAPSTVSAGRRAPAETPASSPGPAESAAQAPSMPPTAPGAEASAPAPVVAAPTSTPVPADPAEDEAGGGAIWYFALPAAALALLGAAVVHRRRRASAEPPDEQAAAAAAPPPPAKPRPDPVPRPWLEIGLKAERAAFTDIEAEIAFELEITNKGGSPARNLRIDVKLFNAGAEQDKEIGAFFRTAGRETTKLKLPGVAAGVTGMIQGTVGMKREDMRAMRLNERLLYVPVLAVNILYDWGEARTGQTSKSYLIGREVQAAGEKMGAFRVDQGPRVWRSVGQRPHKLARRV